MEVLSPEGQEAVSHRAQGGGRQDGKVEEHLERQPGQKKKWSRTQGKGRGKAERARGPGRRVHREGWPSNAVPGVCESHTRVHSCKGHREARSSSAKV